MKKILEKFNQLSRYQKAFLVVAVVFIISTIFLYLFSGPKEQPIPEGTTPTPTIFQSPSATPEPVSEKSRRSYLMNKVIESKPPINGYSWTDSDTISYSSPQGIYVLGNNEPLVSGNIQFISWSDNGTALYQSDNKWYLFAIAAEGKTKTYTRSFSSPLISPDGSYIADFTQNTLELIKTTSNESLKHEFDTKINKIAWSGNSENIIVSSITSQQNSLIILDTNLGRLTQSNFKPEAFLSSLSANGDWIAIKDGSELLVYNPKNDKEIKIDLKPKSSIVTKWLSNYDFILLETFNDINDFQEDHFYRLSVSGGKDYLANSFPLVNRVNVKLDPAINIHKDTVLFLENEGGFWLLSLLSSYLPTYTSGGLIYTPLEDKSH